jgi:ectoine hydroxylase-related dioxygenase (phytanoyl-CoA dioxygenase family)
MTRVELTQMTAIGALVKVAVGPSEDLLGRPQLRDQAFEQGYLCLQGWLDKQQVALASAAVAQVLEGACYLADRRSTDRLEATKSPPEDFFGSGIDRATYAQLQRLEEVHGLVHSAALRQGFSLLVGGKSIIHPNFIIRTIFPNSFATPPHQDLIHTRASENAWTCWIPLIDCPLELGPLAILFNSHGAMFPTKAHANGGREAELPGDAGPWLSGSLGPGDCIFFHGRTVHKALPNRTQSLLRLSLDCRCQPYDEPIQALSLLPHGELQTWDEIYSGWADRTHCRYWEGPPK